MVSEVKLITEGNFLVQTELICFRLGLGLGLDCQIKTIERMYVHNDF